MNSVMSNKCAWIITLGSDDQPAQGIAVQLAKYGLQPQGQRWSTEANSWVASAHEAAHANAAVVIITGQLALLADPAVRRQLALFRLALQTHRQCFINGFIVGTPPVFEAVANTTSILDDWQCVTDTHWTAKAVARAHAPIKPAWPVHLGLHAQERLGTWLETHPTPGHTAAGALLGVSGNNASPDFHAVGASGALPQKTVNEFELKGLKFDARALPFEAWALQNTLMPDQSYYVRIEGEPDFLAVGSLANGEVGDVHLIRLG